MLMMSREGARRDIRRRFTLLAAIVVQAICYLFQFGVSVLKGLLALGFGTTE